MSDLFVQVGNTVGRVTRQILACKLNVPKVRTRAMSSSICCMGPRIWNNVPVRLYQYEVSGVVRHVSVKEFIRIYK